MAKPGPKPKMTPTRKQQILRCVQRGLSVADALLVADVTYDMYRHAKRVDPEFASGIKSASAKGKFTCLEKIHRGAPGWQSSAWFLERKYGTEYGQRMKLDVDTIVVMRIEEVIIADGKIPNIESNGTAPSGTARLSGF